MAKLFFRYGAMGCGKSSNLLQTDYNYKERGQNTLIFTSNIDNRYDIGKVTSRIGISSDAIPITQFDFIYNIFIDELEKRQIHCILVDEVQFFTKEQIYQLSEIVDNYNIPVICYGLLSDFKLNLFPGSEALLSMCDVIENIPTICFCGKRATVNARIVDGKVAKEGEQVQIGGNESYISLCRKHYKEGKIK